MLEEVLEMLPVGGHLTARFSPSEPLAARPDGSAARRKQRRAARSEILQPRPRSGYVTWLGKFFVKLYNQDSWSFEAVSSYLKIVLIVGPG